MVTNFDEWISKTYFSAVKSHQFDTIVQNKKWCLNHVYFSQATPVLLQFLSNFAPEN